MLASRNHGIPWRNRLSTRDEMMTLIEIQRASSSWKLRQLYVQGPVLTVHNETLWHDQSDGDFSSAIRLGIGLRHSWARGRADLLPQRPAVTTFGPCGFGEATVSTMNGTPLESCPLRGIQTGADCWRLLELA